MRTIPSLFTLFLRIMAKSSDAEGYVILWFLGMLYLLWRIISYYAYGKKRGETMFGKRIKKQKTVAQKRDSEMISNHTGKPFTSSDISKKFGMIYIIGEKTI